MNTHAMPFLTSEDCMRASKASVHALSCSSADERRFFEVALAIVACPYLPSFFASSRNQATKSLTSFLPSEFLDTTAK